MKLEVGTGMDEYLRQLGDLEFTADQYIGKAIYYGADIVADRIKANIEAMPVDDTNHPEKRVTGIKSIQKAALAASFGIAKTQNDNGYINVKAGFDGYNKLKSKKYPNGQPNAMIARTYEAGNSFTKKIPFVGPAVRATRAMAEAKMAEVIDTEITKVMK